MRRDTVAALQAWLEEGYRQVGQILIEPGPSGFELRHVVDAGASGLEQFGGSEAARQIATYDDAGAFRPLRTAPNLRRGWLLALPDVASLKAAFDHLYPGMLGVLLSQRRGELVPVHLRETLNRQTGMYALTKKITDENAQGMVGRFCRSEGGCLKTILWRLDAEQPITTLPNGKFDPAVNQTGEQRPALPLLCHEACNLLVAEARTVVKKLQPLPVPVPAPVG